MFSKVKHFLSYNSLSKQLISNRLSMKRQSLAFQVQSILEGYSYQRTKPKPRKRKSHKIPILYLVEASSIGVASTYEVLSYSLNHISCFIYLRKYKPIKRNSLTIRSNFDIYIYPKRIN